MARTINMQTDLQISSCWEHIWLDTCMTSLVKAPPYSKLNFQGKIFFTQNWCNMPSQGHHCFPNFPVVDWFSLFIFLWVLTFPLEDCSEFGNFVITLTRLVIGTSRTFGSAKKFVRITSGFGGGEFTKTLRKVCTCQKLKFSFLLLEYCKIRECYTVANAFTIRNM